MLKKYRPLLITVALLVMLDVAVLVAMVARPNWTERLIPALVGIQILFLIIIALVLYVIHASAENWTSKPQTTAKRNRWVVPLFITLGIFYLVRSLAALVYFALHGGSGTSVIVPLAGLPISMYMFFLARKVINSPREKTPELRSPAPE